MRTLLGQFSWIFVAPLLASVIRALGNGPVLAVQALQVAACHKYRIAFRGRRMEGGRGNRRQGHPANPRLPRQPVYPALMFAELTCFQFPEEFHCSRIRDYHRRLAAPALGMCHPHGERGGVSSPNRDGILTCSFQQARIRTHWRPGRTGP